MPACASRTLRISMGLMALAAIAGCPAKTSANKSPRSSDSDRRSTDGSGTNHVSEDQLVDSSQMPGRIHIVEPKETLMQLAEHYYKDRAQWRRIWQANKNRVSNPNDLPVGMKLIIP